MDLSKGLTMKKYLLVTAAALAVLGATNAFADEPQLIPDCYADGQSQSEFHDCVRRNWGSGGTAAVVSRSESSQVPATEGDSPQTPGDDQSPPAGMWEREHRVAAGNRANDSYARLNEPRQGAYAPPRDWDANSERSDTDGPDWGPPPPDEGYGPPEDRPPPDDDWDSRPTPPDGPYY